MAIIRGVGVRVVGRPRRGKGGGGGAGVLLTMGLCILVSSSLAQSLIQDLKEIGVDKKGFRLRLQKAAQKLEPLNIRVDIPVSIGLPLCNTELLGLTSGHYTLPTGIC